MLIPLDQTPQAVKKCVACGKPVASEFCGKCGAKQP